MRSAVVLCVLAACGFDSPESKDGAPVSIVDDNFADAELLVDGVVTPWGTLEPAAFVVGGLHARAFAGDQVDDDDSYDDVAAKATTLRGASYRQLLVDRGGNGRPRGLGLAANTDYTVLYDGEILLPFGVQKLELTADDRAIVQIATDGVTFGERLFSKNGASSITLDIRKPGWFPIRIAYGQDTGNSRIELATVQNQNTTPVGADRLRARVTDHPGLVAFGFDALGLLAPTGETVVPTIDETFGSLAPGFDLDFTFPDTFSIRHTGQLLVDQAGTYAFRVDAGPDQDDQYRLWIDGTFVASHWASVADAPTGSIALAVGWHDIVFDYADNVGNAEVHLFMDDAPIDPAHLRPAVAKGLVAAHFELAVFTIGDNIITPHGLGLVAPDLGVIDFVDYGFGLQNHQATDLVVELADCKPAQPLVASPENPAVAEFFYFASDARCANTKLTPPEDWRLDFVDSAVGNGGFVGPILFNPTLIASFHGGEREPFTRAVAFISAPLATPAALRFGPVTVTADPRGATIELSIRTAPDEVALAVTPWTIVESGSTPPIAMGSLVQYQLAIAGDGWQYPVVDEVEIQYVSTVLE
ncbi:MAG: PA14 domain-containing protein [Kofleriaceae bacterium]